MGGGSHTREDRARAVSHRSSAHAARPAEARRVRVHDREQNGDTLMASRTDRPSVGGPCVKRRGVAALVALLTFYLVAGLHALAPYLSPGMLPGW